MQLKFYDCKKSRKMLRELRGIFFAQLSVFHLCATFNKWDLIGIFFLWDFFQIEALKTKSELLSGR